MDGISYIVPTYREIQPFLIGIESTLKPVREEVEIIILAQDEKMLDRFKASLGPDKRITYLLGKDASQTMNKAIKLAKCKYIAVLPQNVELLPKTFRAFTEAMRANPKAAMAYSDFYFVDPSGEMQEKRLMDFNGDFTEGFDFGYVKVYRKEFLERVGGYSREYKTPQGLEYDLRLKLLDTYEFFHVGEALYKKHLTKEEAERPYGAFSYLFYPKSVERDIERAFKEMLKRRGAFLRHENEAVKYGKDEAFSPLVSVVIPSRNRERFIGKAIESVLNQTFRDFEIIVVDNCSKDKTAEVAKSYAKRDSRVRVLENKVTLENGISACLNIGLRNARGKYIAQLDSDDEYYPETLEKMVDHLEKHPKCGLAVSYYEAIDDEGNVIKEIGVIKHLEYDRNNILRCGGVGAVRVWQKRVIEEFGGFEEEFGLYGEDYDLTLKVSEKYDVCRVHHVLYRYRQHSGGTVAIVPSDIRVRNKLLARLRALERRIKLNKELAKLKAG